MKTEKQLWGVSPEGKEIFLYTIENGSGAFVRLCSVGAAIVSVAVPDKEGKLADVVLGYPRANDYFADGPCSGKCPGRYANRIAKGKFTLDGVEYTLPVNNGPNHLHGGPQGFQNQVWDSRIIGDAVEFMLKQGADPNWRPKVRGEKFRLPLQVALDNGKKTFPALLMLLRYKADPQVLFDSKAMETSWVICSS